MHKIILYYKYIKIDNPETFYKSHLALCRTLNLKGRVIIAKEGLNGTLEGLSKDIDSYTRALKTDSRFKDINIKIDKSDGNNFPRLSIKIRPEIVALGDPKHQKFPLSLGAKHIEAEELHQWFKDGKEFYIFDMRNNYEHQLGHFKNSLLPKVSHFRETPKALGEFSHFKDKTLVAVCTGGVRCERGSSILKRAGFKNLYQLKNGIVDYINKYPGENFEGSLYVFDKRIVRKPNAAYKAIGCCHKCGVLSESFINCANLACHKHIICCLKCAPKGFGYCSQECQKSKFSFLKWRNLKKLLQF